MARPASISRLWIHTDHETQSKLRQAITVSLGVLALSLLAQVRVPLPFTPVPITGQTLGVLLIGGTLGMRLGTLTTLLYIAIGAVGLPVFADQSGGIHVLFGATGGYLVGFMVASALIGSLADRGWDRNIGTSIVMFTLGHAAIFACGLLWLHQVAPDLNVWQAGLLPFLPGAVVKTLIATGAFPLFWKLRG